MTKQVINIGTSPDKGNGDPLRTAFDKINQNFTELYSALGADATIFDPLNVDTNLVPKTDNTYDLGSPTKQWRHVHTAGGSIYLDNIKLTNVGGKFVATKVVNPGEVNEEPDPEDSDATSEISGGGGASVTVSDTAPESASEGNLWWNSEDGKIYIRYSDAWIDTNVPAAGGGTGDITFAAEEMYRLAGLSISNKDESHNPTAFINIPANGNDDIELRSLYGGVTIGTGPNNVINNIWDFKDNGNLDFPNDLKITNNSTTSNFGKSSSITQTEEYPGGSTTTTQTQESQVEITPSSVIVARRSTQVVDDGVTTTIDVAGTQLDIANTYASLKLYNEPDGPNNSLYRQVKATGSGAILEAVQEDVAGEVAGRVTVAETSVSVFVGDGVTNNTWTFRNDGVLQVPGPDFISWIYQDEVGLALQVDGYPFVFEKTGKIKLPAGGDIVDSNGVSVLGGGSFSGVLNGVEDDATPALDFFSAAQNNHIFTLASDWTLKLKARALGANEGHLYLQAGGSGTRVQVNGSGSTVQVCASDGSQVSWWEFDKTGALTFPDTTVQTTAWTGNTDEKIKIGELAGSSNQGQYAISIGKYAGSSDQETNGIAIGYGAGSNQQGINGIGIGSGAGNLNQGQGAIAIGGGGSGGENQGTMSIAIGYNAGQTSQAANTIILNASGSPFNGIADQTNSFYVNPIRSDNTAAKTLLYNTTTKEVTYGDRDAIIAGNYSLFVSSNGIVNFPTVDNKTLLVTANQIFLEGDDLLLTTLNGGDWIFGDNGNLTIPGNINAVGNVVLKAGNSTFTFGTDGSVSFPNSTVQTTAYTGPGPVLSVYYLNNNSPYKVDFSGSDGIKIPYNTVVDDTDSGWDNVNTQYTCKRTGWYTVTASSGSVTNNNAYYIQLRSGTGNGNIVQQLYAGPPKSVMNGNVIVRLTKDTIYQVRILCGAGAAGDVYGGQYTTYMMLAHLRD